MSADGWLISRSSGGLRLKEAFSAYKVSCENHWSCCVQEDTLASVESTLTLDVHENAVNEVLSRVIK